MGSSIPFTIVADPKPVPNPKNTHAAALITAKCLHGCVVYYLYETAKCFSEVESHPAPTQFVWLAKRMSINNGAGIAERHTIELPISNYFFTRRTILRGVMVGPDGYFRGSFLPGRQHLDGCAADR
jgi:hypothetical protein